MKNIMFMIPSMIRGGAERVVSILANDYASRGWKVSILMLLHSHIGYDLDKSIDVIDISDDSKSVALMYPFLICRARRTVKTLKPDIIVSFMANTCLISGPACRKTKARFVVSERIDPTQDKRNIIVRSMLNSIYSHSDCCIMQTKRAFNYFPDKVKAKSVIIPNPVNVSTIATYGGKRIVASGRLDPQKNHMMLIKAFSSLHEEFDGWRLDIYGEGPERGNLENFIGKLGLDAFVSLKGNVPDLHQQMADADLYVLSSDFEGLSNALIEAMMMGLPCISTDCAGSDEIITDKQDGIIVPVGDITALTEAMRLLMSDRELALSFGRNARISSERFRTKVVIEKWRTAIEGDSHVS
ncbi:MAG: glycosyltransferase family 4 protein [Spirochaetales bacterium]|nr:glycosyltransferase family 4 protein [Spirochaetales bacterium]